MRRLYLQVYLAIVAVLVVFGLLLAASWQLGPARERDEKAVEGLGTVLAEILPREAPRADLERMLQRLARPGSARLSLWGAEGDLIAASGRPIPVPGGVRPRSGFRTDRSGFTAAVRFPDGRWLVARHSHRQVAHGVGLLFGIALLAAAVAIGAYPVARRLTRRLERLRAGVEGLGSGDLHARVPVEGRDEVADLARSFNRAADRIEALLGAQRALLASASHELRSPLARIRVAVELLGAENPDLRARVASDIADLDGLIEELLLASRLQSVETLDRTEEVDLLGLLAEEGARAEADVTGTPVTVHGDARLLRRLVRNLIENARQHGAPPVEARVDVAYGRARLQVCDRGTGVPEAERERIFEPFYRPAGSTSSGGAGLGLSLVRQIALRHGGEARCLARDGGGTCFEVVFVPSR